jgi:hypothetical protein
MEKARVVQSQQRPDDRVVFVARARYGVEALIALLQLARRDVEQPARHLVLKNLQRLSRRQRAARSQQVGLVEAAMGRWSGC